MNAGEKLLSALGDSVPETAGEQLLGALGDTVPLDDPLAAVRQKALLMDNMHFHFRIVKGCFENCCNEFQLKKLTR